MVHRLGVLVRSLRLLGHWELLRYYFRKDVCCLLLRYYAGHFERLSVLLFGKLSWFDDEYDIRETLFINTVFQI